MLREDLRNESGSLERALDALRRDEHVTVTTKAPKRREQVAAHDRHRRGSLRARHASRTGALRPDHGERRAA